MDRNFQSRVWSRSNPVVRVEIAYQKFGRDGRLVWKRKMFKDAEQAERWLEKNNDDINEVRWAEEGR